MMDFRRKDVKTAVLYCLPLFMALAVFILLPVAGTVADSFFRDVTFLPRKFVFLENYSQVFRSEAFWSSLRFTFLFTLVTVPLEVLLGMVFALVLNAAIPGRGLLRAAVLIPWAIPAAVSGRAFELITNYSYGLANWLVLSLGMTQEPVNWLGTAPGAFLAVVLADAWKTTPFVALILLAGLSAIPEDIHRQAMVDGAGMFQRFFRLTLPLLKPVLVVALLFRTIDALRIFDLLYVLTGGGPGGATESLSLLGYRYFLSGDFGGGSAVSVLLFLVAFVLALLHVRLSGFQEDLA